MEKMEDVRIFVAGSLRRALPRALHAAEIEADVVYGPAGLLAQRIAAGAQADLLLRADLGNPRRLKRAGIGLEVIPWVGNRLMLVMLRRGPAARRLDALSLQKTGRSEALPLWLELLLTPGLLIGTPTPKADPCGDYAAALLAGAAKYGAVFPAVLCAMARALVGGGRRSDGGPSRTLREGEPASVPRRPLSLLRLEPRRLPGVGVQFRGDSAGRSARRALRDARDHANRAQRVAGPSDEERCAGAAERGVSGVALMQPSDGS